MNVLICKTFSHKFDSFHNMRRMICLQKQKKQKLNNRSRSYLETACGGDSDDNCVHKKAVKKLRAELSVSFANILSPLIGYVCISVLCSVYFHILAPL